MRHLMSPLDFSVEELDELMDVANDIEANPEKCEYYLPSVVTRLIESGKATVKVLTSSDKWYGVTYKEDKPMVQKAMTDMHESGRYPAKLWE